MADLSSYINISASSITTAGNITASGGASPAPALYGFSSLQAYDSINIGGITINSTDGTNGQVLTTYGNGETYWSTVSGGSYGNSNVATFLASYGSNTITTTGNVSVGQLKVTATNSYNSIQFSDNGTNDNGYIKVDAANIMAINSVGNFSLKQAGNDRISITNTTSDFMAATNVRIQTNKAGFPAFTWNFDSAGNLTAPGNIIGTLANGNSNVNIASANGNVTIASGGSNIVNVTGTGVSTGSGISIAGKITRTGAITSTAWGASGIGITSTNATFTDTSTPAGTQASSFTHTLSGGTLAYSNAVTVTTAAGLYVTAPTAGTNATITNPYSIVAAGNTSLLGTGVTGIGALMTGPIASVPLPNTLASFNSNLNNYTQLTIQNKNTGADATVDFIATADNGTDTVNYIDLGIINSGYDANTPTNSLGNIVYAADGYLYTQGNTSNTSQSGGNLVIGTSTPGKNVKIFVGGVNNSAIMANISNTGMTVNGNVVANNFSGNISITGNVTGTSPNVSLVAGSFTATFDNTGLLTLPAMGGDEGGEINLGIPTSNTSLITAVKFDVYQNRIRFFDGSTKGAYIDLSQAATGVGTLLNNRVSGYVNAGTYVTMDNLKATVSTSGNRSLQIATVSGSFSAYVTAVYTLFTGGVAGTGAAITVTTTPALAINWNFTSQGDTVTYIINDTTNSRTYRITMMIGASYNNNMISIERLI